MIAARIEDLGSGEAGVLKGGEDGRVLVPFGGDDCGVETVGKHAVGDIAGEDDCGRVEDGDKVAGESDEVALAAGVTFAIVLQTKERTSDVEGWGNAEPVGGGGGRTRRRRGNVGIGRGIREVFGIEAIYIHLKYMIVWEKDRGNLAMRVKMVPGMGLGEGAPTSRPMPPHRIAYLT